MDHPANVDDLSGDKGFQWKFHCDLCGSGYDSTFIPSKSANSARRLGFLSSGLSAVGSVAGGSAGSGLWGASQGAGAASQFKGMSAQWHTEHDNAFQQAVNEAKVHFQRCPRCKKYVCPDDWNEEAGLCTTDAPSLTAETQAAKAQVRVEQMQDAVIELSFHHLPRLREAVGFRKILPELRGAARVPGLFKVPASEPPYR